LDGVFVVISQPRTQFSTLEERCHSPFHWPPRAWPLNLKKNTTTQKQLFFLWRGEEDSKRLSDPKGSAAAHKSARDESFLSDQEKAERKPHPPSAEPAPFERLQEFL